MSMPTANPFTPNFGRIPAILAGRETVIYDMERALSSGSSDPNLCTVLSGARGAGKTSLMAYIASRAEEMGWIAASASALPGMLESILELSTASAAHIATLERDMYVKSISFGQLIGVELEKADSTSASWRMRMTALLDALAETDTGLLICIDEIVPDIDDMRTLAAVFQHFISEERKVALLMAGLPANVTKLLEDRSVSFLLRASQYTLGRIDDSAVRLAVRQTIEAAGRRIDDTALESIVESTAGFPYLIQLVGFYAWEANPAAEAITYDDAQYGAERAHSEYTRGVLQRTYNGLTPQERRFVEALADEGGSSTLAAVSQLMGKAPNYARVYRKRLEKQGVIETLGSDRVAFALPLFCEFLRDQG